MKICVLGGTGNISAEIVKLLLRLGHQVTCYNRGQSGEPPQGADVIRGDRQDRERFEQAMQAQKFDAAIDMLCFSKEDALSSIRAFRGVGHFVHCSTTATYGLDFEWMPVTEDHPLRPTMESSRNKVAADNAFLAEYHGSGFPVTIIKPSTTYGPKLGWVRQAAFDLYWIDRVRKGKPILICGDGTAIHQFLHVEDAALGFAHILGRSRCIGQTYNLVRREYVTWLDYHKTAMKVLGREVELVGIPLVDMEAMKIPNLELCKHLFAYNSFYSPEKIFRDVPEFQPRVSLEEGLRRVLESMDREKRVRNSDKYDWEDRAIAAQRAVRTVAIR